MVKKGKSPGEGLAVCPGCGGSGQVTVEKVGKDSKEDSGASIRQTQPCGQCGGAGRVRR